MKNGEAIIKQKDWKNNQTMYHNILQSARFIKTPENYTMLFGLEAAAVMGFIEQLDLQTREKRKTRWIYITNDTFYRKLMLAPKQVLKITDLLKKHNLIEVKLKGVPPIKHYAVNYEITLKLLQTVNLSQMSKLIYQKGRNQILKKDEILLLRKNYLDTLCNKIHEDSNESSFVQKQQQKFIESFQFEELWKLYHKGTKSKALQAWLKLCELPIKSSKVSRPKWKEIKKAIKLQFQSERWTKQPNYIPHTSSWLNGYMWLNDAKDLTLIVDFNAPKRNNSTGYRSGNYKVTKEYIQM